MPGRAIHVPIGGAAGAFGANVRAGNLKDRERAIETLGGAVFGAWSSTWPDLAEPAVVGPHHRGPFHAVLPNTAVWGVWASWVDDLQNRLRAQAAYHQSSAAGSSGTFAGFLHSCIEIIVRILAGALVGVAAGYISHIGLDAMTPMGIGLLGV